jgi:DNA-binding MarR family transcriptional regulator
MGGAYALGMDEFSQRLNETLTTAYRSILKIEDQFLKRTGSLNVSASEMHLMETIGKMKGAGRTVKDIAADLGITQPSVTSAVNRLVMKGCVRRKRSEADGRVVYIHLTKRGHKAYALFSYFHENMVRAVTKGLTEEEKQNLLKGMVRLNEFFIQQIQNLSAETPDDAAEPGDFTSSI